MRPVLFAALFCSLAIIGAATPRDGTPIRGMARVVDGDTLDIGGVHVRLSGIDAPEMGQTCDRYNQAWDCGAFARRVMETLVQGGPVACDPVSAPDIHGRPVAVCHADGRDLGSEMVLAGAAVAYRRYSLAYVEQEQDARQAGKGIWAGRMVAPESFRHSDTSPRPTEGCNIKGNIRDGRHIYHMPGDRYYDRTRVNGPGEAWFCSEAEARSAGFRRAGT